MSRILRNLTEEQAEAYGLVLSSSGLSHRVEMGEDGWDISVPEMVQADALNLIDEYLRENQERDAPEAIAAREYGKDFSGVWVSLLVLGVHVAIGLSDQQRAFFSRYGSAAGLIIDGELYRTLTSLMLHTSVFHLAGNMLGLALFGTAVCQIAGPGVGWFMVLIAGGAGNFINALFYRSHHLSVGSSTAIFGAVGILAGFQFLKKLRRSDGLKKSWLPLAGGLALLAFLGAGKHSDLTAHLFGFLVGTVVGGVYGLSMKRPAGKLCQVCLVVAASGLMALSFIWGHFGGGL